MEACMVNPGTNSFLSKDLIEWRERARERDRQTDREKRERERERERERDRERQRQRQRQTERERERERRERARRERTILVPSVLSLPIPTSSVNGFSLRNHENKSDFPPLKVRLTTKETGTQHIIQAQVTCSERNKKTKTHKRREAIER